MFEIGVYDNILNVKYSFLKNIEEFLDPNVSYGGVIPDITQELVDTVFVLLDSEKSQFSTEIQNSDMQIYLSTTTMSAYQGKFLNSQHGLRVLHIKIASRQNVDVFDRATIQDRIFLNLGSMSNLKFWNAHNSRDFADWEEIEPLTIVDSVDTDEHTSEEGFYVTLYTISFLYTRK